MNSNAHERAALADALFGSLVGSGPTASNLTLTPPRRWCVFALGGWVAAMRFEPGNGSVGFADNWREAIQFQSEDGASLAADLIEKETGTEGQVVWVDLA